MIATKWYILKLKKITREKSRKSNFLKPRVFLCLLKPAYTVTSHKYIKYELQQVYNQFIFVVLMCTSIMP